ncbi:hypothetical protein C8J56DRAFT_139544 [Mycena floridula]|nr:hypothetical protein C8J56DRAFT_139544 [Mycena floridula]
MSSSIPLRLADPELIATVDDFLADVLREARIDSETVEAIRACFCDQSISDHEFIRTTISRLKHYPNLARKLNSVTQALGQKFEIVVNDALTVDLIVIHGPSAGQIYSVSDEIQLPAISNTAKLRALLEKDTIEPDFTNSTSSSSGASAVAELLQHQLVSLAPRARLMALTCTDRHILRLIMYMVQDASDICDGWPARRVFYRPLFSCPMWSVVVLIPSMEEDLRMFTRVN